MTLLRVSLFGRFDVQHGRKSLPVLDASKAQELFCYLLLNQNQPHPREALAHLLWSDSQTARPDRCLRKALWQLRAALDALDERLSDHVLLVEPGWIQLNPGADLWLDVVVFEQAFLRVHDLLGSELTSQYVQRLEQAVGLYRGGLQESWYQDWYLYQRERFQHMYLIMLDKLMDHSEAHHNYAAGLAYGTLILACEPARERTHRRLMRLHQLAGDRAAALRQYQHCVGALERELGVEPAARTVTLYDQIRIDAPGATNVQLPTVVEASPAAALSLPLVLRSLTQLHTLLGHLQQEIHQDVQILMQAIHDQD
jgi:DNA-binding SARP family transcriptional activator